MSEQVVLSACVPPDLAGSRVDRAAAELFDEYSRALIKRWIDAGELTVDGRAVKPKTRLNGGEHLRVSAAIEPREDWRAAQAVDFDVVYEDAELLVVNKPPGVVVHPGAGNRDGTLVNGLLRHRPGLELLPRAGIVHRLDKDTSGLLLVAATLVAHKQLTAQLAQRAVSRRYLALAEGVMVAGRDIDLPIGRHPQNRTRQAVRDDGRAALTRVRVLERYRVHTFIEATLATGRTHQIRVHLAAIGYPLLGDRRYGARGRLPPAADPALVEALRAFRRQALHAAQLGFAHPRSDEWLEFSAPLPADMAALKGLLAADAQAHGGV